MEKKKMEKRIHLRFSIVMSLFMIGIMSFVVTYMNIGWNDQTIEKWLSSFGIAWLVGFPLLYINDITDNLGNLVRLSADDASLSYSGKNFGLMQIEINNDLQILDQWAKTWLVDFNPKKTKALIISNNTNIPELNIRFNDESVELVDNHKHLGVTLKVFCI
jgi:hypothetical protein